MSSQRVSCGLDFTSSSDINSSIETACKAGYDFLCLPIVHPRYRREFIEGPAQNRTGPFTRSDLLLTSHDWGTLVVAKMSPWLQVDSRNDIIRKNSEKALKQELNFGSHLSVPACLINLPGPNCVNLARILNSHILEGHNQQFWMRVPLKPAEEQLDDVIDFSESDQIKNHCSTSNENTWNWWNSLKNMCDSTKKVGIAMDVTADLPSNEVLDRWCGEPIKAAILSTSLFLTNKKGFPVLSRSHQMLLKRLFNLDVQIIITGVGRHSDKGIRSYQQYLDHLWQNRDPPDYVAAFAKGYEDYLQCPLQPLMDNLESQTYEVFEKDPIKYSRYQEAVHYALVDRVLPEDKDKTTVIIMVLGAGRGPLVSASLRAAQNADRKVQVYAVEKNPNAVVTLENLKYEMWGERVTVVSSDMRYWEAPEKADIIVSELLGSFGDNELSPECLDGAQKFLKDDGISIPKEYTSYIAPLTSSKLWNEARACKMDAKPAEASYETPYVVRLHNVNVLSPAKPLFKFSHPNKGIIDNSRYDILDFDILLDATMHGFAGYFDCILYGNVTLSIVPETHSPGMFSWFPIYFPIRQPLYLKGGSKLQVHFWRLCNQKNVWYEWCVSEPEPIPIHNPKGRSYTIGL